MICAYLCICLLVSFTQGYKIISLPNGSDQLEHSVKVRFSTLTSQYTEKVTSTVTVTNYETCYVAEVGIRSCQRRREVGEPVDETPRVEVNGVEVSWESLISPSRVARDLELVKEVYPVESVQVVQPEQGEPASVVYPTVVEHVESRDHSLESPAVEEEIHHHHHHHDHHVHDDNGDALVEDQMTDDDQTTTGAPTDEETTTTTGYEEETTTFEIPADAARENEFGGPLLDDSLEANWEEKEVVLKLRPNHGGCMSGPMADDQLFINVISRVVTTMTEYVTATQAETNRVVLKSEGGCLPSNVDQLFTASCTL